MGEDAENPKKKSVRRGLVLKWPQDHFQLKFQTAANPVFKPQKWPTYPQMLKFVLADFMVDGNITSWKHTEGENQSEQQNLKMVIKKLWFTLQTNIAH